MSKSGSFEGIASKFNDNIYGTSKGKLRHDLLLHYLHPYLIGNKLKVLDIGCGTGVMSAAFAQAGHAVTACDISEEVLNITRQRLIDFDEVEIFQTDINAISGKYDLIIFHAVLEWLEQPIQALDLMPKLLNQNGILSVSFFNNDAKAFSNLLYGNFDYVLAGMPNKNTVRLNPENAQYPKDILAHLRQHFLIKHTAGLRCIHDYLHKKEMIDQQYQTLLNLEIEFGSKEPFKWLGKYFHVLAEKK